MFVADRTMVTTSLAGTVAVSVPSFVHLNSVTRGQHCSTDLAMYMLQSHLSFLAQTWITVFCDVGFRV